METRTIYTTINQSIRRPPPEFLEIARALYAQAMTPEMAVERLEIIQAKIVLEAQRGMVAGLEPLPKLERSQA